MLIFVRLRCYNYVQMNSWCFREHVTIANNNVDIIIFSVE